MKTNMKNNLKIPHIKKGAVKGFFARNKVGVIAASVVCVVIALILAIGGGSKNPYFVAKEPVQQRTIVQNLRFLGRVEAENDSQLAFSRSGLVKSVNVKEGDFVKKGQILVSLDTSELEASRARSAAEVSSSQAQYQKVVSGDRAEDRAIQGQASATAALNVEQTIAKYDSLIADARTTLYSSDLDATPENLSFSQTPPKVSGTYLSSVEGRYVLIVYPSTAGSGISLEYSGLENGASEIAFGVPVKVGTRGIYITFTKGDNYGNTKWIVEVPNKKGTSYSRNLAAYNQLVKDKDIAVAEARLRATTEDLKNKSVVSGARAEDVAISRASLQMSQSGLSQVISQISSSIMRAPFDGVIASLNYKLGEFASSTESGLRLVSNDVYVVKIQVPETDIFFIKEGQEVEIRYDALPGTAYKGTISHVELADSVIDGTRVYQVTAQLQPIEGMTLRPGLTASVYIPVSIPDVLAVKKDAVIYDAKKNTNHVYKIKGEEVEASDVTIGRVSDDGYVEIRTGIQAGDVIGIPEAEN
ncbi:MAG TPA: efflux RND transporter periplasmic adaptor subunit [Candidatus Paceibacterota bacterium]